MIAHDCIVSRRWIYNSKNRNQITGTADLSNDHKRLAKWIMRSPQTTATAGSSFPTICCFSNLATWCPTLIHRDMVCESVFLASVAFCYSTNSQCLLKCSLFFVLNWWTFLANFYVCKQTQILHTGMCRPNVYTLKHTALAEQLPVLLHVTIVHTLH